MTHSPSSAQSDKEIRSSMTSEQIQLERKLTCEAIDGAIAFGYQNTNPPPSDDHWLAPFWNIGRKQAELEARAAASAQASAFDGDSEVTRKAFREYDAEYPVSHRSHWQIWRDAIAYAVKSGIAIPPSTSAHTIGEDAANVAIGEPAAYLVRGLDGHNEEYATVWIKRANAEAAAAVIFRASITPLIEARAALTAEKVAGKEPVAWLFDGATAERTQIGNLHFEGPNAAQLEIAKKYGWKWIPLYATPPSPDAREARGGVTVQAMTSEQREQLQFIVRCDPTFMIYHIKDATNYDWKMLARVFELAKDQALAILGEAGK